MDKRRIKTIEIRLKSHAEKPKKQVAARVIPSHKGKLLCIVALAVACSACTSGSGLSWYGNDYFKLEGTPEGIAAFDEYQNGLITNGKMTDPKSSPAWTIKGKRLDYKMMLLNSKKAKGGN